MMTLDKAKAKEVLLSELGSNPALVDRFLDRYPEIHDELSGSVTKWLEDRSVVDVSAFGISLKEIMAVNNENLLVAVRNMNKLFDKDMDDAARNEWISVLRKPHTIE